MFAGGDFEGGKKMNTETGEIRNLEELTKEELKSGKWVKIPKKHLGNVSNLNRKERREYMKKHGGFAKGKFGWAKI